MGDGVAGVSQDGVSQAEVSPAPDTGNSPVVLRLTCGGEDLFTSTRPWLHPLLDASRFLALAHHHRRDLTDCTLYDKVVGRAAALLIVRLGIRVVHTDTISRRAIPVFESHQVVWRAGTVVDRIDCRTEELLAEETDAERAYQLVRARALAAQADADPAFRALDLRNVTISRGERMVLHNVNLFAGRGEKVLITGANGSGKTSLLKAIIGTVPCTGGGITVARDGRYAPRIGYVNQESVAVTFPMSAREVVEIGVAAVGVPRREKAQRIHDAMAATRCDALARRVYGTLSGGEKQRVAIARCLARGAQLLLLYEPTASLDAHGKAELVSLVEQLADTQEITVLMVTHEFDRMDRSGWRHLVIRDGGLHAVEGGAGAGDTMRAPS